jgi:hypothetical protein
VQRVILTGKLELEPEKPVDPGLTLNEAIAKFFAEQVGLGAKEGTIKPFRKIPWRPTQPSQAGLVQSDTHDCRVCWAFRGCLLERSHNGFVG